jgi:hypothetical protein
VPVCVLQVWPAAQHKGIPKVPQIRAEVQQMPFRHAPLWHWSLAEQEAPLGRFPMQEPKLQ